MQTSYEMFIETPVPDNELIVSRTDLHGNITYANETFAFISGYSVEELVGKPHNVVRHPDMPKSLFKELWETLKSEQIWRGYVKNLRKDGGYYWVYAEVSGVYKNTELVEYKSMRFPVNAELKQKMQKDYDGRKESEEGICRVVCYLKTDILEKVKKLAADEGTKEDKVVDAILRDTLF